MGYIVEHMLRKQLTVIDKFHSHLEPMKFLKHSQLTDQVNSPRPPINVKLIAPEMIRLILTESGFVAFLSPDQFQLLEVWPGDERFELGRIQQSNRPLQISISSLFVVSKF